MVTRVQRAARRLFRTPILVETYLGDTGVGQSFGDPAHVMASVAEQVRVVKNSQGSEVISTAQVFCDPSEEPRFAPESRVTLRSNRTGDVIRAAMHRDQRGRETLLEVFVG